MDINDRFSERLKILQRRLQKCRVSAFQVNHMKNIEYLTGFTGTTGALLVEEESASLMVDGRYVAQAEAEASGVDVRASERDVLRGLWQQTLTTDGPISGGQARGVRAVSIDLAPRICAKRAGDW